jgi:hypothetical protein
MYYYIHLSFYSRISINKIDGMGKNNGFLLLSNRDKSAVKQRSFFFFVIWSNIERAVDGIVPTLLGETRSKIQ